MKKKKKMKTEWESEWVFIAILILYLKYLLTQMITKRSKGYVSHLYAQIKYKSKTFYINNKTRRAD